MEKNVSLRLRGLMGKKTLSALHIGFGFDFEAPVDVIRASFAEGERWTVSSLEKLMPAGSLDADRVAVMVLSCGRDRFYKGFRVLQVYAGGRYDVENDSIKRAARVDYNSLDDFFAKKQFEDMRKGGRFDRAWIISQRAEYIRKPAHYRGEWCSHLSADQLSGRFVSEGYGDARQLGGLQLRTRFPSGALDRSGYRVDIVRDDLRRRAADLKARRRAEAARTADYSADLSALYAAARVLEAAIQAVTARPGFGGVNGWTIRSAFGAFADARCYADAFPALLASGQVRNESGARDRIAAYTQAAREALDSIIPPAAAAADAATA